MDCIILAGSGEDYREVGNSDNKAFLQVAGMPIIQRILEELRQVDEIERLFLIGPQEELRHHIAEVLARQSAGSKHPVKPGPQIEIFEQKRDLIANLQYVLEKTRRGEDPDRQVLILPADTPLITHHEVAEFLAGCDRSFDYQGGLTTEEALTAFYPTRELPGVVMAYFYFREGLFRINNMHLVRPAAFHTEHLIRRTYAMRYQKKGANMLAMMGQILRMAWRAPSAPFTYVGMQLARMLGEAGWRRSSAWLQKCFPFAHLERSISRILDLRFRMVVTHLGGAALDVDNDSDFAAICARFEEWRAMLEKMGRPKA